MKPEAKKKPRLLLQEQPPFNLETLRQLLLDKKVLGTLTMPGDAELEKLARILNGWHGQYYARQVMRPFDNLRAQAREVFSSLAAVIFKLKACNQNYEADAIKESAPTYVMKQLSVRSNEIKSIEKFLEDARYFSILDVESHFVDEGWKWLAQVLPKDFYNAVSPNNKGFEIGIGNTGPIARFVHSVIPCLTGEQPPIGSVGKQLSTAQKDEKQGKKTQIERELWKRF